ncbi:peptidase MA family metallohydrolase [Gaopeijia maritima]|uniref:Peptidase MA family metallohydrolase n=1 Tax=Gaopeijia maritima TaxID=3119007 RepID=A0ABU9EBN6_9BACT
MPPPRTFRRVAVLVALLGLAPGQGAAQRDIDFVPGRVQGDGFVVRFAPGDSLRAEAVAEALLSQPALPVLPPDVPRGVTVVLAPDEAGFRRASGGRPPDWSAGVAIPAFNRIVLPPFRSDRAWGNDAFRTLRHEWAHLALRQAVPGVRVPRWFDEGFAQWASGWNREELWRLRLRVALGRTPPLDSLTFRFPLERAAARDAYLLSATTVEYLVEASGEEALGVFLQRWRETGRFDDALRIVYGVGTPQLEEDWREWLEDRYGWVSVLTSSSIGWGLLGLVVVLLVRIRRSRDRERLARLRATEPPAAPAWWDGDADEPGGGSSGYDPPNTPPAQS